MLTFQLFFFVVLYLADVHYWKLVGRCKNCNVLSNCKYVVNFNKRSYGRRGNHYGVPYDNCNMLQIGFRTKEELLIWEKTVFFFYSAFFTKVWKYEVTICEFTETNWKVLDYYEIYP